jgi:hypothetical protein
MPQHGALCRPGGVHDVVVHPWIPRLQLVRQIGAGAFRNVHKDQPTLVRIGLRETRQQSGLEFVAKQQFIQMIAGVVAVLAHRRGRPIRVGAENAVVDVLRALTRYIKAAEQRVQPGSFVIPKQQFEQRPCVSRRCPTTSLS